MALSLPERVRPWPARIAALDLRAWWSGARAACTAVRDALLRLWAWLLADPARFRAASTGLAVCLLLGAVIGWLVGAVVARSTAMVVHHVQTGP
jgi:hypothetical protein